MTVPLERRAARVLLVDDAGRVLLLNGGDPSAPDRGTWWFTPGGGLEERESPAQAAARELAEETGLRVVADALGAAVHARTTEFRLGTCDYRQSEHYFLLRVPAHQVDTGGAGAVVDPGVVGHRWWSIDELRTTDERVYPEELVEVLNRVMPC
jgi:8-oxo-dGTP pyrophosphatase MutT (NUDIX family)